MKVVNEDIKNLERFIGNKNVEVHADLPLVMADAYNASKETQEKIDKEMEEKQKTDAYVELNKVVGAEKQPVPDLPEEPKAVLDESLFEDYTDEIFEDEDYEYVDFNGQKIIKDKYGYPVMCDNCGYEGYYEGDLEDFDGCCPMCHEHGGAYGFFESLKEDYSNNVREYSDMLFDMIDEGLVDAEHIAKDLIYWCSEDDIKRYMEVNDLISEEEDFDESLKEGLYEINYIDNTGANFVDKVSAVSEDEAVSKFKIKSKNYVNGVKSIKSITDITFDDEDNLEFDESLNEDFSFGEKDGLFIIYLDGEIYMQYPSKEAAEEDGWILTPNDSLFFTVKDNRLTAKNLILVNNLKFTYDKNATPNPSYDCYYFNCETVNTGRRNSFSGRLSIYANDELRYPYHNKDNENTVISFSFGDEKIPFYAVPISNYLSNPKQHDLIVIDKFYEKLRGKNESLKEARGPKKKPLIDRQGNVYDDEDRGEGFDDAFADDLFNTVLAELAPEDSGLYRKTKIPEIPQWRRYDAEKDVGVDYDGNIIVRVNSEDKLNLAKKVAEVYGLKTSGPYKSNAGYKFTLIIPEE